MAAKYPELKIELNGTESGDEVLRRAQRVMYCAAYQLGQALRDDAKKMCYDACGWIPPMKRDPQVKELDFGVPSSLRNACSYETAKTEVEKYLVVELAQ